MTTTLAAIDPNTRRRGLLVEVHPEGDENVSRTVLTKFTERLFDRNIRVGLLVTPKVTLVVRDRLTSLRFSVDEYAVDRVDTQALLDAAQLGRAKSDQAFPDQILRYLTAVAESWSSSVPDEAMQSMIPEVVGQLAQADFEVWSRALEQSDAR